VKLFVNFYCTETVLFLLLLLLLLFSLEAYPFGSRLEFRETLMETVASFCAEQIDDPMEEEEEEEEEEKNEGEAQESDQEEEEEITSAKDAKKKSLFPKFLPDGSEKQPIMTHIIANRIIKRLVVTDHKNPVEGLETR